MHVNEQKREKAPKFNTNPGAQINLKLCKVHCYHYHVDVPHFPHLLEILPDVSRRILLFKSENCSNYLQEFPKMI